VVGGRLKANAEDSLNDPADAGLKTLVNLCASASPRLCVKTLPVARDCPALLPILPIGKWHFLFHDFGNKMVGGGVLP
jgi:hypothetical protein